MKRYGNLYKEIYNYENLKQAHYHARKGKGWYSEVQMVNEDEYCYIKHLQYLLQSKTYETSKYEVFIKNDKGKEREIYKLPYYPDRICQWAIMQVIEPIVVKKLIDNTFSAIPNRGIHLALKRLNKALKQDRNGTEYCLKLDIKKYYPSINHTILKNMLRDVFKDQDLLWLLDEIIESMPENKGLPIGNYTSQYLGNFYKSKFEHWLKEDKHLRYVFAYMDDYVILHHDKQFLHKLKREIDEYLDVNLKLKVKENWQVFPTYIRGIDFVGYRSFGDYTLLRKSTAKNFKVKMRKLKKKHMLDFSDNCTIQSYKGWLKWGDCYNLEKKYIQPLIERND